jgi:hypothetical protein
MMEKIIDPNPWVESGGILGLIIFALLLMIGLIISRMQKKLDDIPLQIEETKAEIMMQLERTKSCVLKSLYESGAVEDRRKRSYPVQDEQRED